MSDLEFKNPSDAEAAFRRALTEEFPDGAAVWDDAVSRRNFLRLMGASLALAGLSGCEQKTPPQEIVPYVKAPEQTEPGRPTFFTSTMPFDGYGRGVLALSREGRPIKIEGNPDHPASLGAADVFMQAAILDLYDPDRAKTTTEAGISRPTSEFNASLAARLANSNGGHGIRLLTRSISSPTVTAQLSEFLKTFPQAAWHVHDPMRPAENQSAFQEPVDAVYDLLSATVIASLDCDLLFAEPGSLRYARQFSDGRRVRKNDLAMNRLYVLESTLSLTGSMADHRVPLGSDEIIDAARALATAVGVETFGPAPTLAPQTKRFIDALASDLTQAGDGRSLVMPGRFQPAEVHAIAHAINQKLGNVGKTVRFIDPVAATGAASLTQLTEDLRAGRVDTLLILDGNPAYDAPVNSGFAEALATVTRQVSGGDYTTLTAHLGTHFNETSYRCQWHLPMAHWLESWGDLRAFDGTASLMQPLIAPMYNGISPPEFMERLLGRTTRSGLDILRDHWKQTVIGDFDAWWLTTLQKGVVANSAAPAREMPASRSSRAAASSNKTSSKSDVEVLFRPDPSIWAGDFANNAWLQELPKPFTKLTWENAIGISIGLARKLGQNGKTLIDGDVVRLKIDGRSIEAPVILIPGQADTVVTLTLGYGRDRGGRLLVDDEGPRGYNAFALRTTESTWSMRGATLESTGRHVALATAQNHHAMANEPGVPGVEPFLKTNVVATLGMTAQELSQENRKLIRTVTLPQYQQHPRFMDQLAPDEKEPLLSLFPGLPRSADLQWGMVIDTTACTGCNACVIACQAENNIPVVGKAEVIKEREMHWIRIDDYFAGSPENPGVYHQPVPCMHCEDAPCEIVCPVGATTHSPEGLNEMTYNRCVGTRFCSNNCPYKVRRFNFLLYSDYNQDSRSLQYNPDVSVRSRGVMEKCTYCVQRIDRTRIEMQSQMQQLRELAAAATTDADRDRLNAMAEQRGRQVVENLQTACQQTCPTHAISFGDIANPAAEVARQKKEPANYTLLRSLTTKPRTSYLARITNPNPALDEGATA